MEKHRTNNEILSFPIDGGIVCVPLKSPDGREEFHLDINRRRANLAKVTYQNRSQTTLILARLDFGAPHRNPDGAEIGIPHLHLYREGYGDKWAFELPKEKFKKPDDLIASFDDFFGILQYNKTTTI